MTEEDAIEGVRVVEEAKEVEKVKNIVLTRRAAQDVEWNVNGELIQMPCLDVQRFQRENQIMEGLENDGSDRAQGTIEQIASIEPRSWNKYWRSAYGYEFPSDRPNVSTRNNFDKFQAFLQNRLDNGNQAWDKSSGCKALRSKRTTNHASLDCHGRVLMNTLCPE